MIDSRKMTATKWLIYSIAVNFIQLAVIITLLINYKGCD